MKSNRLLWGSVGLAALLSTFLFLLGFVQAVRTVLYPESAPSLPEPAPSAAPAATAAPDPLASDKINILALGDSLTKGTGDTSGKGYVERVKEGLAENTGKPVHVWNYAIVGSKTDDLLRELDKPASPLIDFAKQANLILLTVGGNDMFQMGVAGQNVLNSQGELNIDFGSLVKNLPPALGRLDKILTKLAETNPNARVVYVMFYHPFLDVDKKRAGSIYVQQWHGKAFEIANRYPNVTVVPTYDLFEQNLLKYLYTDHFHPNADGYTRISDRVVQALE